MIRLGSMQRLNAAGAVLVASAMLSFGQTTTAKRATPSKPDTWQKSKECANQAEKVVKDKEIILSGWQNHYSPKYDRCFVTETRLTPGEGAGKDFPEVQYTLIDAFERSVLAQWVSEYPHSEGPLNALSCHIDYRLAECAKAKLFIAEHMKN